MKSDKITFISFLYFQEGGIQLIEEFQLKAKPYFEKYGIEIVHQYQPVSKGQIGSVQNEIEQPDMIQLFTAERIENFQSYTADDQVKKLSELRNSGLRKMNVSFGTEKEANDIISKSAVNAIHGIALCSFKNSDGINSLMEFNEKGHRTGLFSKYGIHSEKFIQVMKSMAAIGELDFQQPELIVIFGIDEVSKMKAYLADQNYVALAPIRDNAVKTYHFFMCK